MPLGAGADTTPPMHFGRLNAPEARPEECSGGLCAFSGVDLLTRASHVLPTQARMRPGSRLKHRPSGEITASKAPHSGETVAGPSDFWALAKAVYTGRIMALGDAFSAGIAPKAPPKNPHSLIPARARALPTHACALAGALPGENPKWKAPNMSPFLKCRNAVAKAGSFSLRLLGLPDILAPKIPPERIELATRVRGIEAQPSPFLEAISQRPYTPGELQCDPYPAELLNSMGQQSSAPASLDLRDLRRANIERQAEWCPDQLPDLSFRGNELAGETGEACNVIKKLERERHGWRGSRSTKAELAEELADVVNCADLCALNAGIDLAAAVVSKFNTTSDKNGLKTRIGLTPAKAGKFDGGALQNLVASMARREEKRDVAVKTLKRLGYNWQMAGDHGHWEPPAHFTPPKPLPEPAPGVADDLRDAIAYALNDHNPDGLEWLRAWNEGDEVACRELAEWRERERIRAAKRQRPGRPPEPGCDACATLGRACAEHRP